MPEGQLGGRVQKDRFDQAVLRRARHGSGQCGILLRLLNEKTCDARDYGRREAGEITGGRITVGLARLGNKAVARCDYVRLAASGAGRSVSGVRRVRQSEISQLGCKVRSAYRIDYASDGAAGLGVYFSISGSTSLPINSIVSITNSWE